MKYLKINAILIFMTLFIFQPFCFAAKSLNWQIYNIDVIENVDQQNEVGFKTFRFSLRAQALNLADYYSLASVSKDNEVFIKIDEDSAPDGLIFPSVSNSYSAVDIPLKDGIYKIFVDGEIRITIEITGNKMSVLENYQINNN